MGYGRRLLRYLTDELRRNKLLYLLLLFILMTGFVFGLAAPVSMQPESAAQCRAYVGDFLTLLPDLEVDLRSEFLRALRLNGALFAVILLSGLHPLAIPFAAAALFYKAFTLGFAASFLLAYQAGTGFWIIFCAMLPQNLLLLPFLLWLGGEAFSNALLLRRRRAAFACDTKRQLQHYGLIGLGAAAAIFFSSLLQGYFTPFLLEAFYLLL